MSLEVEHNGEKINIFVNCWIDVRDKYGKWYESQVIEMNLTQIKVHYKGWKSIHDEWIELNEADRIVPVNSVVPKSKVNPKEGMVDCQRGKRIDCLDACDKWYPATIVDTSNLQAYVNYDNWDEKYNEWINQDSYRLAPLHTFTANESSTSKPTSGVSPCCQSNSGYSSSQSDESNFEAALRRSKKWEISRMGDDGNCLFRAISHQVYGSQEYHLLVREKCMDYIESEAEFFRNYIAVDFNEYCAAKRKSGIWGDNVEIQAMSEIYERPIEIYAYQLAPMKVYTQNHSNPPIRLSYHYDSHYNSIIHPLTFDSTFSTLKPGQTEDLKIEQVKERPPRLRRQDSEDNVELQLALEVSRRQFNQELSQDFDLLAHNNMISFELDDSIISYDDQVRLAMNASLDESHSEELDSELQRAIMLSINSG